LSAARGPFTGGPLRLTSTRAHAESGYFRNASQNRRIDGRELWLADAHGDHQRQLTNRGAKTTGFSRWSPDGRSIALHSRQAETAQIYVVDADSGVARQITKDKQGSVAPWWSEDGAGDIEERPVDGYLAPGPGFYPVEDGFCYVNSRLETPRVFRFYSFATKKSIDIAPAPPTLNIGLSVSPDRRRLVYCADTVGNADVLLFELK
jgi:Tol biopolymer transport system component